jgi:hypothetical protein
MDPRVRRLSAIAYLCRLILLEDLLNAQWPFNTRYYMIELCPGLRWGTGPLSHGTTGTPDLEAVDLYGLLVETETVLGVAEELLDLQAVIALQLNHLAHALGLGVTDDGSIAGCVLGQHEWMWMGGESGANIPNSFLMTLRIFLWSNFAGMPWTVVKVFRPLRSAIMSAMLLISRIDRKGYDTYVGFGYGCTPGFE